MQETTDFNPLYQEQHWQNQITYYRRSFQSDKKARSPRNPPGNPKPPNGIDVSKQVFSDLKYKIKRGRK